MKDWNVDQAIAAQKVYEANGGKMSDPNSPLSQWAAVLRIEELRHKHETGDSFAVLEAVFECAMRELVMPEWVALGFIERMRRIKHFKAKTLDETFGSYLPKGAKLVAYRQAREKGILAYCEVKKRHAAGASIGQELFAAIGKDLGIGDSKVRDYYYDWNRRLSYKKPPE